MALGTDYIIRYLSDISGAVQGAKQIEAINSTLGKDIQAQYGQAIRSIGQLPTQIKEIPIKFNGQDAIKTIRTVGEVVQTTNGNFLQLGKTQTFINGTLLSTSNSFKNVTSEFVKGNLEAAKGNKVFTNFADNVKQLAGRALLTIPIWIALRAAIMGFFQGISGGIKDLIAFDLSLQKIRNNLQGTPEEVAIAFTKIRTSITNASKETGISTERLADAVKQFATLGFSANESLQGALGASKLSIALFGDAGETAGAFARALNIMIDRSVGAKSAIDQMNEAFALTSQLEETNNFEIKNVTEALDKFAGTAAGVGLTMNQTLAILAALGTAGRRGAEGATLLSTGFNQLLVNIPKITKMLGLTVEAGESTFTTFRKVIDEITRLNSIPGGKNSAVEAMAEIFGGAGRGVKIVQSLVAVKDILDKNIATLPSFAALNVKVERTMNSESKQAEILGNNIKEMGKSFITSVAGSEDFTGAIIKINKAVRILSTGLNDLGTSLNLMFTNFGAVNLLSSAFIKSIKDLDKKAQFEFQKIIDGLRGQLAIPDLTLLIEKLTLEQKPGDKATMQLISSLRKKLQEQMSAGEIKLEPKVEIAPVVSFKKQQEIAKAILGFKIDELKLNKATNSEVLLGTQVYTDQLGIVEELIDKLKRRLDAEVAIDEENKKLSELQKTGLIENQLKILELQGATNLQLVQQRIELERMYGVNKTREDLLRDELELNKAITEEKFNQNKVSSDTVKLFEIAQKYGRNPAIKISEILSGKIPEKDLSRYLSNNNDLLKIMQEFFSSQLEQIQAAEFFFRGPGRDIPISERTAIKEFRPLPLETIAMPPINTTVGDINIEIKRLFKEEDTAKQILDAILEAIQNNPTIETAINEKIDEF